MFHTTVRLLMAEDFFGHPSYSYQNYGGYWLMGWQEYKQLPLVELMPEYTIVVATTILFFAHK